MSRRQLHNRLVRAYDHLPPKDRIALMLEAHARGDEGERDRLKDAAPMYAYRLQDHFGRATALYRLAWRYLAQQLQLAVTFWRGQGLLERYERWEAEGDEVGERRERCLGWVRVIARRLTDDIDAEGIRADLSGGVLTVRLPKAEALKQRRIRVNA